MQNRKRVEFMRKEKLRAQIGENIRNERISRNISIDELAEMLGLTSGFVGLIERGQRGTTPTTLYKLSEIFDKSIDAFFHEDVSKALFLSEAPEEQKKIKRSKVSSFVADLSERELDFVIAMIKSLRSVTRSAYDDMEDEDIFEEMYDE